MKLPRPYPRVAYRGVLPVAQTLVFIALTVIGCPYIQAAIQHTHLGHRAQGVRASDAGTVGWDPSCIDSVMSLSEQAASGINFPAILASIVFEPVAKEFNLECRRRDYFMHASTLLFVPILWYGVGRLLDGRPVVRSSRFNLNKPLVWTLVTIVALVTGLGATAFALNPEFPVFQALVIAWLALTLLVLIKQAKSRPQPRIAPRSGQ